MSPSSMHIQTVCLALWFCKSSNGKMGRAKSVECGYKRCPQTKEGVLNVHLVPHSHFDAGWIKTFDQYYYGTNSQISAASVKLIYHSVLSELLHDSRRKFTFSESSYFWRWWGEQRATTRKTFRTLVREGRIEFAGGGYVQNDEATTHYASIIDQFTWGLRRLNDTLGPCGRPKAGWQIDPYGHSKEMASLFAQMGYDGLFLGRVDFTKREAMMLGDNMENIWRGSEVLGKMSDIMTHTMFNLYNAPDGFCFDFLCSDEPIVDDGNSAAFNADQRVEDFIIQLDHQASYYGTDNIMVTMGGDFTYQNAASWYMNIDKLMSLVNTRQVTNDSDISIFYSSPSCYLKAVYLHNRKDTVFMEKGDHLPYGSDAETYWSGFFSSRPSLKYLERFGYNLMQITKQLAVLSKSSESVELHEMRHAMALLQHHDAITGTSQQHVINDYVRVVSEAMAGCREQVSQYVTQLTGFWFGHRRQGRSQHLFTYCYQLNISRCEISVSTDDFLVVVYNPLSDHVRYHVRLPIASHNSMKLPTNYSILDSDSVVLDHQINSLTLADTHLAGPKSNTGNELWFEANVPPIGFHAFRVSVRGSSYQKTTSQIVASQAKFLFIANQYLKVSIDKNTGLLQYIHTGKDKRFSIMQNFFFYSQENKSQEQSSGAYCFRPHSEAKAVSMNAKYQIIKGSLIKEIRQTFSDWLSQVIRLYRGRDFVEFEWIVGPIPLGKHLGKEVITRFQTNMTTSGIFYTDSNGRQMMKRSCLQPQTKMLKPLPSCYYPVVSRARLHDVNTGVDLIVITDRTQGASSYREGELELMVHRRLLTDEGFGLEEPLNEEEFGSGLVVKGRYRLMIGQQVQNDEPPLMERAAHIARQFAQGVFVAAADEISHRKWQRLKNKQISALRPQGLPQFAHILTLEPWRGGGVLLRLENTHEIERDDRSTITVDLRKIFEMRMVSARETTLAANQWLDEARQMDWSTRFSYDNSKEIEDVTDKQIRNSKAKMPDNHERHKDDNLKETNDKNSEKIMGKGLKYSFERKRRSVNDTEYLKIIDSSEINATSLIDLLAAQINYKNISAKNVSFSEENHIKSTHTENYDILQIIEKNINNDYLDEKEKANNNPLLNLSTEILPQAPVYSRVEENHPTVETATERSNIHIEIDAPADNSSSQYDNREGSRKNKDKRAYSLMNKKLQHQYRRGSQGNNAHKYKVKASNGQIDDGVTRPMSDILKTPQYVTKFNGIHINEDSLDNSKKSKRIGNNKRARNKLSSEREWKSEKLSKLSDKTTLIRAVNKKGTNIFSGEDLSLEDDDDDLDDFVKNLKKIEEIADALEDVIPKSNLARLRAKKRREELSIEDPDSTESNLHSNGDISSNVEFLESFIEKPNRNKRGRKKRSPMEQKSYHHTAGVNSVEDDEVKYIIRLRATQIRTFVVRFE